MKNFHKKISITLSLFLLISQSLMSGTAQAATTPSLGSAATYGILSNTYTNTTAGMTVNGDIGFTTGPAVTPGGTHTNFGSGGPYTTAGADQGSALAALNSQPCTFTFAAGAVDLSTDTTHGVIGVYAPGVYCSVGAMNVGGALTLSGNGTYIFRPVGALTSTSGSAVALLGGASACDAFWTPSGAATLAANTTFLGTIIDDAGITVGANATWSGQALAYAGTVTTDTDTITVPSCGLPPPPPAADLTVTKIVVNDDGGTKVVADFPLFVGGTPVISGDVNSFADGSYAITETMDPAYAQTFSGDCDASGNISLTAGDNKACTITNDDIAVVPSGGGGGSGSSTRHSSHRIIEPTVLVAADILPSVVEPMGVAQNVANVPVISPRLPNTGYPPENQKNSLLLPILLTSFLAIFLGAIFIKRTV